ncbi:hypothetical protein HOY82DRAFT_672671 [Tuber indicum]|nr:hypothetical protein HOY82DRAFT_672671 [Tuber indicum]
MISFFLTILILLRSIVLASELEETRLVFPELIVPVTQAFPTRAYIAEHTGNIFFSGDEKNGNEITALVSFRIPDDERYNMCQLIFELPEELPPALDIPEYRWSFAGSECILDIYALCGCHKVAAEKTPWYSKPPRYPPKPVYRFFQSKGGGRAGILGYPFHCPLGEVLEFEIAAAVRDKPMMLHWYEMEKPRSGITLEMSRMNTSYEHNVEDYSDDEDSGLEGDTVTVSPKAKDRRSLHLGNCQSVAGPLIEDADNFY